MKDHVSQPRRTTDNTVILSILILKFSERERETEREREKERKKERKNKISEQGLPAFSRSITVFDLM